MLGLIFVVYKYVYPLFKPVKEEMDVQTTEVTRGDLRITVPCDGTVVPRVLVEVKSKASGVVEKLEVEPGDCGRAGADDLRAGPQGCRGPPGAGPGQPTMHPRRSSR